MMLLSFTKRRLFSARPDGPRPGDILLFCHARGISRIIPWFTGSRYYHCGLYDGEGHVLEARPNGVMRRDLKRDPKMAFRVIPMPEGAGEIALNHSRGCIGCRYDVMDVFFIILRHYFPRITPPYSRCDSLVCSELVVDAWRKAGLDLFPGQQSATVIPADFEPFLPPDAHDESFFARGQVGEE
jgi:hypothetical protein